MSVFKTTPMSVLRNNSSPLDAAIQQRQIIFPLPPMSYISKYTAAAVSSGTAPSPPPLPHAAAVFTMFSEPYYKDDHVVRALEAQGQRRLYPQQYDPKKELKKLNISAVANFLDLLQIVSHEPGSPKRQEKIEHINIIFINMHHLLNEYRPHQARDTIREILKSQIDSAKKTNDTAKEYNDKSTDILEKLKKELNSYKSSHKLAKDVLSECGLSDLIEVDSEINTITKHKMENKKRKLEDNNDMSCNDVKVKKEATQVINMKQSVIISDKVKDTNLWQQLFTELDE